jgi:hypothetical protein
MRYLLAILLAVAPAAGVTGAVLRPPPEIHCVKGWHYDDLHHLCVKDGTPDDLVVG